LEKKVNQEAIRKIDTKDIFSVVKGFPKQVSDAIEIGRKIDTGSTKKENIKNIIITGLGGSAIGGDLIKMYLKDIIDIPIIVNRDYFLPKFVNSNTLVIISSYSGNTEETISAYKDAISKKANVICITTGGEVQKLAGSNNHTVINIPKGFQPRFALGFMFFAQLFILIKLGFLKEPKTEIDSLLKKLNENSAEYSSFESKNPMINIAEKIKDKFVYIYSTVNLETIGVRLRGQLAENSKVIASNHTFPEMNHNEIVGWTKDGHILDSLTKSAVMLLNDKDDYKRVTYRTEVTKEIIGKYTKDIFELSGTGESFLERMFHLLYQIDWISYYLAIMNEADPAEIKNIDYLKEKLSSFK
jgi:glucose/mannose-6-phosphate isomerase